MTNENELKLEEEKSRYCTTCIHARNPWSESLKSDGWVGCSYPRFFYRLFESINSNKTFPIEEPSEDTLFSFMSGGFNSEVEMAIGWITGSHIVHEGSGDGIAINDQLLVRNVSKCIAKNCDGFIHPWIQQERLSKEYE